MPLINEVREVHSNWSDRRKTHDPTWSVFERMEAEDGSRHTATMRVPLRNVRLEDKAGVVVVNQYVTGSRRALSECEYESVVRGLIVANESEMRGSDRDLRLREG